MSQYAESVDGFEVDSSHPDETPAAVVAAPVAAAPAVASEPDDDILIETPDAPHGRKPNGQFAAKPGAPAVEATEGDEPAAETQAEKPRNRRDDPKAAVQAAISKQREAERKAADLERRLQEVEARTAPPKAETAKPAAAEYERFLAMPDAPREEDFDSYTKFTAAMGLFVADKRLEERETQSRQTAEAQRREQAIAAVNDRYIAQIDEATTADPEFLNTLHEDVLAIPTYDALREGERPTGLHVVGEEIRRSAAVVPVLRYFSQHPEQIQRLAALPPREITRQLAILESRLAAAPTASAPVASVRSQAKPPVRPVTGSPSVALDDDGSEDESVDAHIRRENAREQKRRRA